MKPIMLLLLCCLGCATARVEAVPLKEGAAAAAPTVVVLLSQKNELSEMVVKGFLENTDAKVVALANADKLSTASLLSAVQSQQPQLLLTLGTAASVLARDKLSAYAQIFTLVLNYREQHLDREGMMGIAMEGGPVSEFTQFKMVIPKMRKVLVPCQNGANAFTRVATDLQALNIELTPVPLAPGVDVATLIPQAQSMDAMWISADPFVLGQAKQLLGAARARHLPVVNSVSARLAHAGALASVAVDIPSIGAQAANMANAYLFSHVSKADIGVQSPMGTRLVVNTEVAKQEGVDIPLAVLPFVGEIATSVQPLP